MSELVSKLRRYGIQWPDETARGFIGTYIELCELAAVEIESLSKRVAELEGALRELTDDAAALLTFIPNPGQSIPVANVKHSVEKSRSTLGER